jgi:hypothetical protein
LGQYKCKEWDFKSYAYEFLDTTVCVWALRL